MTVSLQVAILKAAIEKYSSDIDVVVHTRIDSTNSWCLQQIKKDKKLPFVCFAEEQTQGRGRRGKDWLMPANSNIAMSIAWPFMLSHQQLQLLPLSIALAIAETLECFSVEHVQIKWPNDVYVKDKKIAGILIETQSVVRSSVEKNIAVVIGIGLNYDISALNEKTAQVLLATDICSEVKSSAAKLERLAVATSLLQNAIVACQNYRQSVKRNLEKFRTKYDYCHQKNIEIVLDDKITLSGLAQGVNDNAELLVLIDGEQQIFNSAEISVKVN
ncbi:hypothetical protein MNBD_GAMMA06-1246 [hydrothermal vent metagenome]|uniref:BPL/LPL catalytic domain-containing protein n=1 Tax=hydrothermal vent metagenome TaxID=652676 RepID=A0A3B0WPA4_9ZZZZ